MKILLFFSWRFSRWKKISIKISAGACFHSNSVLCAGDACAVVHSQHHCIVRVIKLLNKFHLSPLLSHRTQKRERKNENLFRHSRSAQKMENFQEENRWNVSYCRSGFEMANKYSGKYFRRTGGIQSRCLPICNSQNASKLSHFISRHSFPGQTNRTPLTMNWIWCIIQAYHADNCSISRETNKRGIESVKSI